MIFLNNPDDMKKVFFSTSCLAYSSIKRTYRPGKEAFIPFSLAPLWHQNHFSFY